MKIIGGKLIELLSINSLENDCLHVKITFNNQSASFKWKIDKETSNALLEVLQSQSKNCKYRLSLKSHWDENENSYVSTVTKVNADGSERLSFLCSDMYVGNLNYIKGMQSSSELKTFLDSIAAQAKEEQQTEAEQEILQTNASSNRGRLLTKVIGMCLFVSIVICLLIVFSGYTFSSTNVSVLHHVNSSKTLSMKSDLQVFQYNEKVSSSEKTSSSLLPAAELNELVNFYVPDNKVAITFDDGPSRFTKEIVEILEEYQVGGTFFFLGLYVEKYPNIVSYVDEHGYSIGNHSYSHSSFLELSPTNIIREVQNTNQLIEAITEKTVRLFRPPFGANNKKVSDTIKQQNMKVVLWDKDPEDWDIKSADQIYQEVANTDPSGSIYLFHETQATVDALPQIIEFLKEQNVEMVNLH
ncbi:polysaccharide deacetylase family protein [Aquibacillus albus]|uniref:Peptidoglycan/xylan/chitin deacetylase (PgdA/CDA1 family) n=1 Tax=Aquibacillus albus TaxID=1168171 RepID=A0ABS2MX69_9BACI|nr:polysaccharide deacetylase family protein [Aquibacillus albus]MBM7570449.1 peptidoglycan/xylan/chitin deacetylase (PgdA/CDA1 family) [Aquibacillus albus]